MKYETLPIERIRRDSGAQFRDGLSQNHVGNMTDALNEGATLPAIVVYFDGETYWLSDGEHRLEAHLRAGRDSIEARVVPGNQMAARRAGRKANGEHLALPRSNKAKRAAVADALRDTDWSDWSDRQIAAATAVSHTYVANLRKELDPQTLPQSGNVATFDPRRDVVIEGAMPFELDLSLEYQGILQHQMPWVFVNIIPDESGHWSVRVGREGLDGMFSETKRGVKGDSVSAVVQILGELTMAQINEGKWIPSPAGAADSIRSNMREVVKGARDIGESLEKSRATLQNNEAFEQWIEAEFSGNPDGAPALIEFAKKARQNEQSPYYSDGFMQGEAMDALGAFGRSIE